MTARFRPRPSRVVRTVVVSHSARAALSLTKKRLPNFVTWSGPMEPKMWVPTNRPTAPMPETSMMLKRRSQRTRQASPSPTSKTRASSPPSGMPAAVNAALIVPLSTSSSMVPVTRVPSFSWSASRMLAGQTTRASGATRFLKTLVSMVWWADGMTTTSTSPNALIFPSISSSTAMGDHTRIFCSSRRTMIMFRGSGKGKLP
mmetsp:Transcript_9853/g.25034  ORF Transcript_9853/g.25034 Transcript_9853/m.25034 type:complete len:202 (+) Transcript_9853:24-629(+)